MRDACAQSDPARNPNFSRRWTHPPGRRKRRADPWSGETCQLEALPPDRIAHLLRNAILRQLATDQYGDDLEQEVRERQQITRLLAALLHDSGSP
jgi:hypothetical protein